MRRKGEVDEKSALRNRLEEAEEILRALGSGRADAIVRFSPSGQQVLTLPGTEAPYRLMVETMNEGAVTLALDGTILYSNKRFADLIAREPEKLIGSHLQDFVVPNEVARFNAQLRRACGETTRDRVRLLRLDGTQVPTYTAMSSLVASGVQGIVAIVTDLSELKRAQSTRDLLARIVEDARDGIAGMDMDGVVTFWNRAAESIYGYSEHEMIAHKMDVLALPDRMEEFGRLIAAIRRGDHVDRFETITRRKDGAHVNVELSLSPISNEFGVTTGISVVVRDIGERKRVMHMSQHDFLTGLANRSLFVSAVEVAIAAARRGAAGFAVLYLDLDRFKDVNDTLGHPVGDLLLRAVGERLQASVRETDTVARFGGDEFAIIQTQVHEPSNAAVLAGAVMEALKERFTIQGNDIRTDASVGIAVYGTDASDAETLLSRADVALYRAKADGRGTYRFFTEELDDDVRTRVALVSDLRKAIVDEQFSLVYQPQVDIDTGRIAGVEALLRWRHPTRGIVGPDAFIPAAETSGLIVQIGRWVVHTACQQMKTWLDAGIAPPLMAVNLSARQMKAALSLERDIEVALAETGLLPRYLELELTESVLMQVSQAHNDVLMRFHDVGLRIALDDFGTGYSSLDYLRRFPVDRIKIAQSFIFDLPANARMAVIVKAAIRLALSLKIELVVEGVENSAQLELVRSWGANTVQGYYYAKPMSARSIAVLLRKGKIPPARHATP